MVGRSQLGICTSHHLSLLSLQNAPARLPCRYVTRDRVQNMLDYEYLQCFLTLKTARGKDTCFFAFADTVVAKAFGRDNECHGWIGIKFQSSPG